MPISIKINRRKRYDGTNYRNYEFTDETSQFDPKGKWQPGSDCYTRAYTVRIPKHLPNSMAEAWIEKNMENLTWVD